MGNADPLALKKSDCVAIWSLTSYSAFGLARMLSSRLLPSMAALLRSTESAVYWMVLPCMAIMPSTPMLISSRATSTSIMLKPDWCSDLCRDFNSMTGAPWRKVRVGSGRPG